MRAVRHRSADDEDGFDAECGEAGTVEPRQQRRSGDQQARPAVLDRVLDLGAAPGGWSQVAVKRVGPRGRVVCIDILPLDAIAGVTFAQIDFLDPDAPDKLKAMLGGPADVVLSDMAANATGHRPTDHLKIMALVEAAAEFAGEVLNEGGSFLAKVIQGGTEAALLAMLKRDFATVKHVKPAASRADSAELYVLATGFRGG